MNQTCERATAELNKLKDAQSSIKRDQERAMKDVENQVKTAQKTASQAKTESIAAKSRRDGVAAELSSLKQELSALDDQLAICASGVKRLSKEVDTLTQKVTLHPNIYIYVNEVIILVYLLGCRCTRAV